MNLSDFDFELPENLIALNPLKPRDSSKLLRVNSLGDFQDSVFRNITEYLSEGDLFVTDYIKTKQRLVRLEKKIDLLELQLNSLKSDNKIINLFKKY